MLNRIFNALEWKKIRIILEYAVYMIAVLLLQSLLFSRLSIFGVKGFVIPAAAVAAGIYLGGVRGAVFGIVLGLLTDMSFSETTVLFTVLFPIIGFGAGFASEFYINKSFFAFMIFSTAALLVCALVQMLHAIIGGGTQILPALITALIQTGLSILPTMLLYVPFREGGVLRYS